MAVTVNQVGYLPKSVKIAHLTGGGKNFELVDAETNKTVFEGQVKKGWYDEPSDENVDFCDFSEFCNPGKYYLSVDKKDKSYTFEIGNNVYASFLDELILTIFYQRCGYKLPEGYKNPYMHDACHLGTHYIMAEKSEGVKFRMRMT